jgi:hypothetical protein
MAILLIKCFTSTFFIIAELKSYLINTPQQEKLKESEY